jgi:CO/xanthine dehydrogenase FAD-binding subunit
MLRRMLASRSLKPPPFIYFAPDTLDEALELLQEHGDEAKVLAGGQSLVPLLALRLARPTVLVDLNRIPGMSDISASNGSVIFGAMARERQAERSELVRQRVPLLADAIPLIGHVAIRTRGTVGGSLAHADPAAELPAVALALDATLSVRSAAEGARTIAASDFFEGFLSTSLHPDEVVTQITFPAARPGTGTSFMEAARRHGDFAIVGAGCSITLEAGVVSDARVVLIGVAQTALRRSEAEGQLIGSSADAASVAAAAAAAAADLEPASDLHGTSAYRRHVAGVMVRRALEQAISRANGAA